MASLQLDSRGHFHGASYIVPLLCRRPRSTVADPKACAVQTAVQAADTDLPAERRGLPEAGAERRGLPDGGARSHRSES